MRQATLVLVALGALTSTVTAATVNVGPGQSIQSAINGASDGDEIVVAPGTYHEAIDFAGKAITLRSSGGPDVTVIDASGLASSVVTCENGERADTVLEGFTITGGEGNELLSDRVGGGMMNNLTEPTVMNCIFVQNSANEGGGMWNRGLDPVVINCMFIENTAAEETGLGGGGMYNRSSDPTLINCVFSGNAVTKFGGGISLQAGTLTLINCEFQGNTATSGGAIYTTDATLSLVNSTISDNNATSWGGGVASLSTTATVSNCILWNNAPEQILDFGGVATLNHCDIMGGWSGPGTSNSDTDPMFVDPANGDYRLSESSPCIDAGDNAAVPAGVDTDLDGNQRIVNVVDLGPYEYGASAPTGGPPAAPSGLVATAVSMSAIDLAWTDNAGDEEGYEIERSLNGATWTLVASLGANATSFSDSGLAPDTTYAYRVVAFNGSGYSDASNWASATTDPEPLMPPAAPTDLVATALSTSEISLSWTDNATDEEGFEIDRSTNGTTWTLIATLGANSTFFTDQGLASDTTYFYRVVAFNDAGYSDESDWASATTDPEPPGPPAAPSDLVATTVSTSEIALSWSDNAVDENGFDVERSIEGGAWQQRASLGANVTSFSDTGLSPETTATYRVIAYNAFGDSDYSNVASATTDPEPATNVVLPLINLTVSLGNLQSGNLPQLEASDNDRLVVRAVTQGNKRRTNLVVASASPHANVTRLDLTVEARAVTPVKMRVYLKNFNNDRWVRLGTYELTSADRIFEFPAVSNPNRFIRNDDGRVQVRIRTVAQKNQTPGGYELKLDEVRVEVTP